ncbi:MAG: glutaryl-7-ACA acylase [Opitutus sp.]|nr:glutaryl-7-ACA acylase [Opitutus sp.]
MNRFHAATCFVSCFSLVVGFATAQTPPLTPDIPPKFEVPTESFDYVRRVEEIPMRDGVKLHTVIMIPKGVKDAPILFTRTPYDADGRTTRTKASPRLVATVALADEIYVTDGYIRVFQDVRGIHNSAGDYVMTRPPRGPLNDTGIDHSTDAWDSIEWLVKNIPETNGRVGMIGSSYEGFTVVMALLDPHPALKVAVPQSPMIDGWMGDDWFHYGAFRQVNFDYFTGQFGGKGGGNAALRGNVDDYEAFRRAGSAGEFARMTGIDQLPIWRKLTEHPSYDAYWQNQALDRLLAAKPLSVPTMWVQSLWDQEDIWGAVHAYPVMEAKDRANDRNHLVLGPWFHSQINRVGFSLGPFLWDGDTTRHVRERIIKPFLDQHLKSGAPKADTPPAYIYNTGRNQWERYTRWPLAGADAAQKPTPLYLHENFSLSFDAPPAHAAGAAGFDEYISDPAKPVPYQPRPVKFEDSEAWRRWLVGDQRFVADRPDVLTYVTEPLTEPLHLAGAPIAHLVASTSGTDSDWVVKLIDVYPEEYSSQPELGGYQLGVSMEIFRGRYRESFEKPAPLASNQPLEFTFQMPHANHVFQPGHRIMVQIQSTWFPLYDRNPQKFVPNIFFAQPTDYVKATQRLFRTGANATRIDLPVVR